MKPLMIDLFAGLGGWAEGGLAEGYDIVGFDIERHIYGEHRYPAQLVLQDVLTLNGSQFKDASLIVASPPCQEYSYMAMPWSRAKAIAVDYRSGVRDVKKLTALFDACFRIQREAIEVAGHFIPLIVENVCGAQPWVGRSRWNYGSYHLWGDVPALMPVTKQFKSHGMNWSDRTKRGQDFTRIAGNQAMGIKAGDRNKGRKNGEHKWTTSWNEGQKIPGNNAPRMWKERRVQRLRDAQEHPFYNSSSKSNSRKAASAMIAKIPFPLAQYIAKVFKPIKTSKHIPG